MRLYAKFRLFFLDYVAEIMKKEFFRLQISRPSCKAESMLRRM